MSGESANRKPAGNAPVDPVSLQRHKRCSISLKVQYRSFDDFKVNYTRNVSRGGMFLLTKASYNVGDTITLHLFVPDFLEAVKIVGEVVHRQYDENDDSKTGIGIKFIEIEADSKEMLVDYLSMLESTE